MTHLLPGYWDTIVIAVAALVLWTLGNYFKRKPLKIVGMIFTFLALFLYVGEKLLYG